MELWNYYRIMLESSDLEKGLFLVYATLNIFLSFDLAVFSVNSQVYLSLLSFLLIIQYQHLNVGVFC